MNDIGVKRGIASKHFVATDFDPLKWMNVKKGIASAYFVETDFNLDTERC